MTTAKITYELPTICCHTVHRSSRCPPLGNHHCGAKKKIRAPSPATSRSRNGPAPVGRLMTPIREGLSDKFDGAQRQNELLANRFGCLDVPGTTEINPPDRVIGFGIRAQQFRSPVDDNTMWRLSLELLRGPPALIHARSTTSG
jgi:hypothetical protein